MKHTLFSAASYLYYAFARYFGGFAFDAGDRGAV